MKYTRFQRAEEREPAGFSAENNSVGIEQVCSVLALIGKYRKRREIGDRVESRVCPFKGKEFEASVCGNYLMAN